VKDAMRSGDAADQARTIEELMDVLVRRVAAYLPRIPTPC
jgi:hypothetical protein